ncbi:MAG: hypothetical protein NVSMB57_03430 [Actinomycetota bacterium]
MERTEYKSLALILARDLAENLATPLLVTDALGTMVFYNEPAERILGRRFAETGELTVSQWSTLWAPRDEHGAALQWQSTALGVALIERRPAHQRLQMTGLDVVVRTLEVSAFPLFASATDFTGAVAVFWEESL